jgi:hypothetical protein
VHCRPWIWIVWVALGFAGGAEAVNLDLGGGVSAGNREGVRAGSETQSDTVFRVKPTINLRELDGRFRWNLGYDAVYEHFLDLTDLSSWNHFLRGGFNWSLGPQTSFSLTERFGYFESVTLFNEQPSVEDGAQDPELIDEQRTRWRNNLAMSLAHRFTPFDSVSLNASQFIANNGDDRADTNGYGLVGSYSRRVSAATSLGMNGGVNRQVVESPGGAASRATNFYNVSGTLSHRFSSSLDLSLSAGPTWVDSEAPEAETPEFFIAPVFPLTGARGEEELVAFESCPVQDGFSFLTAECSGVPEPLTGQQVFVLENVLGLLPFEGDLEQASSDSLTYFANVVLRKQWARGNAQIFYRRGATGATTTSLGSSSITDALGGSIAWRFGPRWRARLNVVYTLRTQGSDSVVPGTQLLPAPAIFGIAGGSQAVAVRPLSVNRDAEITQLNTGLSIDYQLGRRTALFARLGYYSQERSVNGVVVNTLDRFSLLVGFNFRFDTILL